MNNFDFQKMNDKEIIKYVQRNYFELIRYICTKVAYTYRHTPLEWEDFYNVFLMNSPKILKNYNSKINNNFKFYIANSCENFIRNYARKYMTKAHNILNDSINIKAIEYKLSDSDITYHTDTSKLTDMEFRIYTQIVLEGLDRRSVCIANNISAYKLRMILINIKLKIV